MKRRSVLGGLGTVAGATVAGCLGGGSNNEKDTSEGPAWFRKATMDVNEEETKGRLTIHVSRKAQISEVSMYDPSGQLLNTAIVGNNQRQVGVSQVEVSTMPLQFYGMNPGTYEVSAIVDGERKEKQPVEVVRQFTLNNLSLEYQSSGGKQWVAGFKASVTNLGLYPYVLTSMGPVDGVPNPPEDGEPGSAKPTAQDGREVVWWEQFKQFVEDRGEAAGPLVKPEEQGTPSADELSGEFETTLHFVTTKNTHEIPVTYRLDGDLVQTERGWAMSGGEIVSVDGLNPTATTESGE